MNIPSKVLVQPEVGKKEKVWLRLEMEKQPYRVDYEGRKVRFPNLPGFEFLVVRMGTPKKPYYSFTEAKTGCRVAYARTEREALAAGKKRLEETITRKGFQFLRRVIALFPPVMSLTDSAPTEQEQKDGTIVPSVQGVKALVF